MITYIIIDEPHPQLRVWYDITTHVMFTVSWHVYFFRGKQKYKFCKKTKIKSLEENLV